VVANKRAGDGRSESGLGAAPFYLVLSPGLLGFGRCRSAREARCVRVGSATRLPRTAHMSTRAPWAPRPLPMSRRSDGTRLRRSLQDVEMTFGCLRRGFHKA